MIFFLPVCWKYQSHSRAAGNSGPIQELKGIQVKIRFCLVPGGLKQGGFVFPSFLPKICCRVISENSQNGAAGIIMDQCLNLGCVFQTLGASLTPEYQHSQF